MSPCVYLRNWIEKYINNYIVKWSFFLFDLSIQNKVSNILTNMLIDLNDLQL